MTLQFASLAEFAAMGGHGAYVWSSYALALAILLANVVVPLWRRQQFFAAARRRLRRDKTHR